MSRHIIIGSAFAAVVLFLSGSTIYAMPVVSTFDTDAEGWTAAGDISGAVSWSAIGGNPAGHIEVNDAATGGVTNFIAPAKFLGDHSASYSTALTFDLRQSYTGGANQFDDADVILTGAGLTLVFDTPVNPTNSVWTFYSVLLTETSGWHISTLTGPVPTQAQMRSVLADITALKIRAEFQSGSDTGSIDNVFLRTMSQGTPVQASIYQAVEVGWPTVAGKIYQVQSTTLLDNPSWTDFGQPVLGNGAEKSVFDSTRSASKRFYRVIEVDELAQ